MSYSIRKNVIEPLFLITFEVDTTFDYEGLEQAIYEAVSSNGIDIKWQSDCHNHNN